MKRIGLLSDTHSFLDERVFHYFEECDEIWHAGDIGTMELVDRLREFKPLRIVYGNIDGKIFREKIPLDERFECEGMDIWMTHIGGYPGRYNKRVKAVLEENQPDVFICGHSHILKVMPDKKHDLLHINPGACGIYGFHTVKTIIRFAIEDGKIKDMEAIELGNK